MPNKTKKLAKDIMSNNNKTLTANVIRFPTSENKRNKHQGTIEVPQIVSDIQKKVNGSAALNGGFDVLMYKVEKIEETQEKIVGTVTSIHEAIYHPDNGIFARINSTRASQIEDKTDLEKKITEFNSWKEFEIKASSEDKSSEKDLKEKVTSHQESIHELNKFKTTTSAIAKWFVVAIAGGVLTLGFRALYELWIIK